MVKMKTVAKCESCNGQFPIPEIAPTKKIVWCKSCWYTRGKILHKIAHDYSDVTQDEEK